MPSPVVGTPSDPSTKVDITTTNLYTLLELLDSTQANLIRGRVANYAALPAAASHTDEIYLVLAAQGVWPVNRKPAGIYVSDGATWTRTGLVDTILLDSNFVLGDNADPTKQLAFELSSISTGTVITLTVPNSDGTIALNGHTHVIANITDFTDNSSDWDTAYGWGDHSSAGYITTYDPTEADVLDHIAAIATRLDVGGANELSFLTSAFTGSGNIVTLGTIATGVWQGTAIADGYIASAATWNALVSCTTANVTSVGALMDSEVDNLADVKSFDPADYATAAQGSTADSALQDVADDSTPQLGGDLDGQGNAVWDTTAKVAALSAHSSSGDLTLNYDSGAYQSVTVSDDIEGFNFTNWPTAGFQIMIVEITNGGSGTVTWEDGSDNDLLGEDATAPTLQSSGVDIIAFVRNGTNSYAAVPLSLNLGAITT
jgi:hypothetical protein